MAPLSVGFSRQEYWSCLPCPSPGDLPNPEMELGLFKSHALADKFFTSSTTWEAHKHTYMQLICINYVLESLVCFLKGCLKRL